jgi:hypothetical protein
MMGYTVDQEKGDHTGSRNYRPGDQNEEGAETLAILRDDNWLNMGCELGGENSHDFRLGSILFCDRKVY